MLESCETVTRQRLFNFADILQAAPKYLFKVDIHLFIV